MNLKVKMVVKNFYYIVVVNFVMLGILVFLNLFVFKLLGVIEYSYW